MEAIICILLTSIIGMIAWFANDLSSTMKNIQRDISDIAKTVEHVSTSHENLDRRVEKVEKWRESISNSNGHGK